MPTFATWELMRDEIIRNLDPNEDRIVELYEPISRLKSCDPETYRRLVAVRLMASYQSAVTEYLHPRNTFKQSSLHGEAIALGSVAEKLLEIALREYERRGLITQAEIHNFIKQWPKKNTYNGLVQVFKKTQTECTFESLLNELDQLRRKRNSVHLDAMAVTDELDVYHHEFDVIRYRKTVDKLAAVIGKDTRLIEN